MDYIPLKRKRFNHSESVTRKRQKRIKSTYNGDPQLLSRVKQLLIANKYSKHVDDDELLSDLLQMYPEYKRKKKNPLKFAIQKALNVCTNCIEERSSSEERIPENVSNLDEGFSPNSDKYMVYEDTNLINKAVRGLYKGAQLEKESESCRPRTATVNNIQGNIPSLSEKFENQNDLNASAQQQLKPEKIKIISTKSKKSACKVPITEKSSVTFADIGGIEDTIKDIFRLLVLLKHPRTYETIGVTSPRGFLLHGPPGCGKTLIAHAIAGELGLPFIEVAATELVSGVSGESESKIRDLFDGAVSNAPCILFIDEIDAITPKREFAQKGMEKRIVSQLLKCMDDLNGRDSSSQVLVIGATNQPDSLDPALRRPGRFDRDISVGIPNENARIRILHVLCKNVKLIPGFDFRWLAKNTPGYVGADLKAITTEAAAFATYRMFKKYNECAPLLLGDENGHFEKCLKSSLASYDLQTITSWLKDIPPLTEDQLQELFVETSDFQAALCVYQPSVKREGFAAIPNITWDDIGALKEARKVLQRAILLPIKYRDVCDKHHITSVGGVLLFGPKGCGKTLLAKAVANECNINFLSVKGPELLNMYVGESERAVRHCFQMARNAAPCVIFFDEVDALCPSRSHNTENAVADRVVTQLLTLIDGVESAKPIIIMGATNRPDKIDSAMLRPGRFGRILHIGLPSPEDRTDILKRITKNGTQPMLSKDVSIESIAMDSRCDGFSGADLTFLVMEASLEALTDYAANNTIRNQTKNFVVSQAHFEVAFLTVKPSVSEKERKFFKRMASKLL